MASPLFSCNAASTFKISMTSPTRPSTVEHCDRRNACFLSSRTIRYRSVIISRKISRSDSFVKSVFFARRNAYQRPAQRAVLPTKPQREMNLKNPIGQRAAASLSEARPIERLVCGFREIDVAKYAAETSLSRFAEARIDHFDG